MKRIPLTQGQVALVDDGDYPRLRRFKWYAHKMKSGFYTARNVRRPDGTRTLVSIHQFLFPNAACVDHRDGNGLNNRRKNLRPTSHSINQHSFARKRKGTTSRFRGVSWCSREKKWRATIMVDWKYKSLGYFQLETQAARAYDTAAIQITGTPVNFLPA